MAEPATAALDRLAGSNWFPLAAAPGLLRNGTLMAIDRFVDRLSKHCQRLSQSLFGDR